MTQAHHVENLLGEEWPAPQRTLQEIKLTIVEKDNAIEMQLGGTQQLWKFNIWKLKEILNAEELKEWRFHNCPMFAARAMVVTDALVKAAGRGFTLYDP